MKPSISILLATYNSGLYLEEQLQSLYDQSFKDWMLKVSDDGSSDNTLEILKKFQGKYHNIEILPKCDVRLRAYKNFVRLLQETDSDYYMFCDHDDVWLKNKIEISFSKIKEIEREYPDKPVVVHTDMFVVDEELQIIDKSFWRYSDLIPDFTKFEDVVNCHCGNGCTMLFNKQARNAALKYVDFAKMHDILINLSVSANDGIIYPIKQPTVLYRQHRDNVIGAQKRNMNYYFKKFTKLKLVIKSNMTIYKNANVFRRMTPLSYIFSKIRVFLIRRICPYSCNYDNSEILYNNHYVQQRKDC